MDALEAYGYDEQWASLFAAEAPEGSQPGRVVRHDGIAVMVATSNGISPVHVRRSERVTTGDWVAVSDNVVSAVLTRRSLLRRRDPRGDIEQQLAANIDIVMVVCGLDRDFKAGLLQRSLALIGDSGASPYIVLTKVDVVDDETPLLKELDDEYPGVPVITVSSTKGHGVDDIREAVKGRTTVLLGESGAGKSTLTNALLGTDEIEIGEVREKDASGRHTTSTRQLHLLPSGGVLIDNPGIRSLGLFGVEEESVDDAFDDIAEVAEECRFSDCGHTNEPGCAIRQGLADGSLPTDRVEAWLALQADAAAAAERAQQHKWRHPGGRGKRR